MRLLFDCERPPCLDPVPLRETSSAASGCGMLCHEHGMSTKGSLLAVITGFRSGQTLRYELPRVIEDGGISFCCKVPAFLRAQYEAASESRPRQCRENFVEIPHRMAGSLTCE